MPEVPQLADLLSEYKRLDPAVELQRCKELLSFAAPLVDRNVEPKKWAAIRGAYANLCESDDPEAAIAAYRDALTVWRPGLDRDSWSYCHCQIGRLLASMHRPGTAEAEQAIAHLECTVVDQPYLAELLAALYGFRPLGELAAITKPFYFTHHHGQHAVASSVEARSANGKVVRVGFSNSYRDTNDEPTFTRLAGEQAAGFFKLFAASRSNNAR